MLYIFATFSCSRHSIPSIFVEEVRRSTAKETNDLITDQAFVLDLYRAIGGHAVGSRRGSRPSGPGTVRLHNIPWRRCKCWDAELAVDYSVACGYIFHQYRQTVRMSCLRESVTFLVVVIQSFSWSIRLRVRSDSEGFKFDFLHIVSL